MLKKYKLVSILLLMLGGILSSVEGVIFYVDVNGTDTTGYGTQTKPWKTLSYAVSHIPSNFQQGSVVHLNAGIFTEIQQSVVPIGVSIEGAGINSTILRGAIINSISNGIALISLKSSPVQSGNQTLSNFKIDGNNKNLYKGIEISGRNNVVIHDIIFSEIYFNGAEITSGGTAGDHAPPATYLTGFQAYNLTFNNCSRDITSSLTTGVLQLAHLDRAVIHDITISENKGNGITYINKGWFKGLKIYNCNINVPGYDLYFGSDKAIELWNLYDDCEIYNNNCNGWFSLLEGNKGGGTKSVKIHDNKLIYQGTAQTKAIEISVSDIEIYNNYISGFGFGSQISGINNMSNISIHNNTFYDQILYQVLITLRKNVSTNTNYSVTNVEIYNNVFDSVNDGNAPDDINIESVGGASGPLNGFKVKNNIFMTDNGVSVNLFNTAINVTVRNAEAKFNCLYNTTKGNYALGVDFGNNLENTDPRIQRVGNRYDDLYYRLQPNSSLIEAGTDVGFPYIGNVPDIGRYEYGTPDTIPPSRITDLSIVSISSLTATLSWTAVGDDGASGTASRYDIRYSTVLDDIVNWSNNAIKCGSELNPHVAGSIETYNIAGLSPSTVYYFGIKVRDEVLINWNGVSNIITTQTQPPDPPDAILPAKIADLVISDYDSTSITLSWTAVGDDGASGTAIKYEIRRSNTEINDSNWASATICDNSIIPKPAGNVESFRIEALTPLTQYYFAVKAADEIFNWSVVSNSPGTITLETGYSKPVVSGLSQKTVSEQVLNWGAWTNSQQIVVTFAITDLDILNTFQYNIQFSTTSNFSINYIDFVCPETTTLSAGVTSYVTSVLPEGRWFWRVRAKDNTGLYGDYVSGDSVGLKNFGIDLSEPNSVMINSIITYISSAAITASANDNMSGLNSTPYRVRYSISQVFDAGTITESDWFSNKYYTNAILPNTTYYFQVRARDALGNDSGWTSLSGKVTKCNIPTVTWGEVYTSSISIRWSNPAPSNPADTLYIIELSSTNFKGGTNSMIGATTCAAGELTVEGLNQRTVYWARVAAVNYVNEASVRILSNTKITSGTGGGGGGGSGGGSGEGGNDFASPEPAGDLTATPIGDNKIKLDWSESTSADAENYRVYMSTGEIDYTTPSYVVNSTQTELTIDNLTDGQEYKFAVRTVDEFGNEDTNTNEVAETAVDNLSDTIITKLSTPTNGMKISGTNVLLLADNLIGDTTNIKEVTFEYRKFGDTDWITIPVPDHVSGQNNPDAVSPYYMQWDVSGLENNQQYNLRAKATDTNGIAEENAGYITVKIDNVDPDIEETGNHKYERIYNNKLNEVKILDTYTNLISSIKISTGVLTSGATDKLKITMNTADAPQVSKNLIQIGYIYKIELESGQTQFLDNLEITLPYKDSDDNNRIDENDILSSKLMIYTYNEKAIKWDKITTTKIDKANKLATGITKHLSFYGVFAALQNDLVIAHVYPNPFKPSLGHTKIYFTNLTSHSKLKIFNVAGELVYEDDKNTPTGELTWDANNNNSEPIASGVYIYMIINNNSQIKKGKLAIVR